MSRAIKKWEHAKADAIKIMWDAADDAYSSVYSGHDLGDFHLDVTDQDATYVVYTFCFKVEKKNGENSKG